MLELRNRITSFLSCLFCLFAFIGNGSAQETTALKGRLLNANNQQPLPYANVAILNKSGGTITNESGSFVLNSSTLSPEDSISFLFIGFATKNVSVRDFKKNPTVYLTEEVFNLSEAFVFADEKDPRVIIKKVLENKDLNYIKSDQKNKVFIRSQYSSDINHFKLNFKKSSFAHLDEKMTQFIEHKIPEKSISYADFLGDIYFSKKEDDSIKIVPIKMVALKEKDLADLKQLEEIFENMFKNTKEKEYWKIQSGIIGSKIKLTEAEKKDSLAASKTTRIPLTYFSSQINKELNNLINDKNEWEFLYRTNKYNYTLIGGTRFNGENVYIIDFEPIKSGKYIGKVYISMETYALVKADYEFAPEKNGTNIHLFGIGYTENVFSNSVSFEKKNGSYQLKYYSQKSGESSSFDRNISLLKKKERLFFDKKLNELKIGLNFSVDSKTTKEYFVLNAERITSHIYKNTTQPKFIKTIYVDQFDDKLWKGYATIEPTKQMKDYKKHGL